MAPGRELSGVEEVIGVNIQLQRALRNVSREELARAIDIRVGLLRQYENGEQAVPVSELARMARYLRVPPARFFPSSGVGGPAGSDPSAADSRAPARADHVARRLLGKFESIRDPKVRAAILRLVEAVAGETRDDR